MPRDREHFTLPRWSEPLPRRPQGGGGRRSSRDDRGAHGSALSQQAAALADTLERRAAGARGVDPKLIFRIRLNGTYGALSEEQIERYGLGVLAREPGNLVVVFPNDSTLLELRRRLREYSGAGEEGFTYGELDAIETIEPLGPDDRIGARLRARSVAIGELASLDVELWHPGSRDQCLRWIAQLGDRLATVGARITDSYVGTGLCVLRVRAEARGMQELLAEDLDFIKEIERPPTPTFEMLELQRAEADDLPDIGAELSSNASGVLVVDSGVVSHPLLGPVLGDAQVFPDRLRRSSASAGDGDVAGGHGTAVCGIAVYGDLGECIATRTFIPRALLFSARVTDDANQYDEDELLEHQLEQAVTYFVERYPQIHVINVSLGNRESVYQEGSRQFRFAAAIDELAYRFRDREIVFVVSAGNYLPDNVSGEEIVQSYPRYLHQDPLGKILDPATAALALTVGSLSYGSGRRAGGLTEDRVDRLVAGERGYPSPFTRVGWGVGEAIKPELVDYGGDVRFEMGTLRERVAQWAGVPTTDRDYASGRLFRTVAGTSFAAPRISNLACRLFSEFPGSSSNLVRALLADSARVPSNRPDALSELDHADDDILKLYGYGQPSFERARWSSDHEVLLLTDGIIELDQFQLFELPSLPPGFVDADGTGEIAVTLSFDPPTRHTRADSYLGVTMEASLFRNVQPSRVAELLRDELQSEREERNGVRRDSVSDLPTSARVDLKPGVNRRKAGTLQRGVYRIGSSRWQYDGAGLVLAVTCRRKWAPESISSQRFAAVVSLSHSNDSIRIYEHIRQQIELRELQRTRVRA